MNKKNIILLLSISVFIGFSSCKKNYTCTCTDGRGFAYTTEIKATKKKAEALCTDQQNSSGSLGRYSCTIE